MVDAAQKRRQALNELVLKRGTELVKLLDEKHPARVMWEEAPEEGRRDIGHALLYQKTGVAGPPLHKGPTAYYKAKLLLGSRPTDLVPSLTEKHANLFMAQSEHPTPLGWLWAHAQSQDDALEKATSPRSVEVLYWTLRMLQSPRRRQAMLTFREGVFGDNVEGRVVDRLDELKPVDLSGSPVRTLETAVERAVREEWKGDDQLVKPEPWHTMVPEGVTVLVTYRGLRAEGKNMRHCVASYANGVAEGRFHILSVNNEHGRSTAAMSSKGRVTQHKGHGNSEPPSEHKPLLAKAAEVYVMHGGNREE